VGTLVQRRKASGPLRDVMLARMVNAVLGGAAVGPWDIADLDDNSLDAILAFVYDVPGAQAAMAEIEAEKARIRAEHPTYGK
jgi:hypothetical protein